MAGRTGEGRTLELTRYMTILAGRDCMLSYQRKPGQVMVEPDRLRPVFLGVTAFAALSQLVLVDIIQTVTIGTALAGFFLLD